MAQTGLADSPGKREERGAQARLSYWLDLMPFTDRKQQKRSGFEEIENSDLNKLSARCLIDLEEQVLG